MKSKNETTREQCFFVTPIGDEGTPERQRADWIFHQVIKPAADAVNMDAERADLMLGSSMIGTNIFRALSEAPLCVADLTGLNPNVLYEIGVRHCLRKPIVHIAQRGTKLPFDNAPHMTHFYELAEYKSVHGLCADLESEFRHILSESYVTSNPFTQALGAIEISRSGDPLAALVSQLSERLNALEGLAPFAGHSPISMDFNSADDAKRLLSAFIRAKDRTDPYNPDTLRRALDLANDDFNLYIAVGEAIKACNRSNRADLKRVYDDHVPF